MTEPQIIEKDGEPASAVVPIAEWRRLMEQLEDLEDARAMEIVLNDPNRCMVPGAVVKALLDGHHPLKVWREHRDLSRIDLADMTGLTSRYIGHLEAGQRQGTSEVLRRLATALDVSIDDLVPVEPAVEEERGRGE